MKRIQSLIIAMLAVLTAWAQGGSGDAYDPTNPPDPQSGIRLSLEASPANGGTVSPSRAVYLPAGTQIRLSASPRLGYEFRAWMDGDQVVSPTPDFEYTTTSEPKKLIAWFDKVEYNPANPGDPFIDGYTHRLSVYCTPSIGGSVSNSNMLVREGETVTLYAYPSGSFKFSCWKKDGKILGIEPQLDVTMGTENLEYTAQFVYSPTSPGNPGTNSWNSATGQLIVDSFNPDGLEQTIRNIVGDDNMDKVTSLVVIGPMNSYDFGAVRNLTNLTDADFRRTSGADRVPSWAMQDCKALTRLLLPESVQTVEYAAFYGCSNLSELVAYPFTPDLHNSLRALYAQ